MSDVVTISLITVAGVTLLSLIITLLLKKDVGEYHKAVNGHMTNLLQLTEAKGKLEGKAEEKEENKK